MNITEVRVFPIRDKDKLKAFVSIVIDGCFIVSDIKIIQGGNGLFLSMPGKLGKNGKFRDIVHPLDAETRKLIEDKVFSKYREIVEGGAASANNAPSTTTES
jgi:stage V sporulation protein G